MRVTIALTLFAGAFLIAPGPASAAPLSLGGQAAMSQELTNGQFERVARRSTQVRRYARVKSRRYDWTYYPYWRPYQYRYWQHYYPYGGPLF